MREQHRDPEPEPVPHGLALRANRPDVIDEEFEGEAVLVNLQTGCYYAFNDAATAIWSAIEGGRSARALASGLGMSESEVSAFLGTLLAEQLVQPAPEDLGADGLEPAEATTTAPGLQRFTDMQDLLMLDPIHDIDLDGDGWPVTAAAE